MNPPESRLSVRVLAPIAAMQALVRDGVLGGGDTVLVFRRGEGEWYDVVIGPASTTTTWRLTCGFTPTASTLVRAGASSRSAKRSKTLKAPVGMPSL